MRVAVLGPTGFGGSNIAIELLNRGNSVVGISRNPGKLGTHKNYEPRQLDLENATVNDLVKAFADVEAVVNAYNPPYSPNVYRTFVETVRRFVAAAKASKHLQYFVSIGGTGSLYIDAKTHMTAADSRNFWLAYRHAVADSETATYHMEERVGFNSPVAKGMRAYREARQALNAGSATEDDRYLIAEAEKPTREGKDFANDIPLAARATYMFFDSNTSFTWTFVSPPARYLPGPRTGKYKVYVDTVPLSDSQPADFENEFDGRLLGCSAADLAVAVADEIEKREKIGKHWSPVADIREDEQYSSYARLT